MLKLWPLVNVVAWCACISLRSYASQGDVSNSKVELDDSSIEGHCLSMMQVKARRRLAPGTSSSVYSPSSANASDDSPLYLDDTLRLHPGKTGGGTFTWRLSHWNVTMGQSCHPEPCPDELGFFPRALITVRDPVEAFESAFNWRAWVLCLAENETRVVSSTDAAAQSTSEFCEDNPEEAAILHKKYAFNSSNLAEAMCDEGRLGQEARQDLDQIRHAKWPLIDWLPNNSLQQISVAAMVLEPGFDFDDQMFSVTKWAVKESLGDDAVKDFRMMKNSGIEQTPDEKLHSSKQSSYHPSPLSNLGKCCMTRHLATSYELISNLATEGCKGGQAHVCKAALRAIYTRHQVFLNSSMSCRELALLL